MSQPLRGSKAARRCLALCQGDSPPWIPIFWGLWGSGILVPASLVLTTETIARLPIFSERKNSALRTGQPIRRAVFLPKVKGTRSMGCTDLGFRTGELFSLRKKRTAGIRVSAWQGRGSLYRLDPQPFPPLKNYGFQGDLIPLAGGSQGQSLRL